MKYRVKWEEVKSIVIEAESEDEARELAYGYFYEKATLEGQDEIGVFENAVTVDDEQVWREADDINAFPECPVCAEIMGVMKDGNLVS